MKERSRCPDPVIGIFGGIRPRTTVICPLSASAFVMYTVGPPSSPQSIMLQVSL